MTRSSSIQLLSDGKSMVVDLVDWRVNGRFNKTIYCIIIDLYIYI